MNDYGLFPYSATSWNGVVKCPHCSREHTMTDLEKGDLIALGKVVLDCPVCDCWYTVRDDGDDNPYVYSH